MFVLVFQSQFRRKQKKRAKTRQKRAKSYKAANCYNASNRVTLLDFPILARNEASSWHICFLTSLAIKGMSKLIPRDPKTHKIRRELKEEESCCPSFQISAIILQFSASLSSTFLPC